MKEPIILKVLRAKHKLHLSILLTIGVLLGCNDDRTPSSLSEIIDAGVLKVGTNYGITTYHYGSSGPEGFEYELAQGFASYLGVSLEVFPYYNLSDLFPRLQDQHFDLIAANVTVSEQRKQSLKFGPSYQQTSQKLMFKQGKEWPKKIEDLNGSIMVVDDSHQHQALLNLDQKYANLVWQATNEKDVEELLEMVLNEELDFTLADSNILALMRRRHPELAIGFSVGQKQDIAWAVDINQDDSLLAALIEYFGVIRQNGTLKALEDKYFGHVRQFNYVDTREFIRAAKTVLPQFKEWFIQYAGDLDWRLIAAMSYQESHWKPNARSVTGVRGMMMLTLGTARDLGIKSRLDPEQSIKGGAKYLAQILRRIPARIQEPDKTWFALAAYNVGLGHLEDARVLTERQGGNPDMWVDVKSRLLQLRQKKYYKTTKYGYARGHEAVAYVDNIRRYYDSLVWLDENPSELLEQEFKAPNSAQ